MPTTSCSGDGISWMRRFLGEDESAPIRHPEIISGFDMRVLGLKLPQSKRTTAATIIPSVGCPMGCNFCTTSAFFGGKGHYLNFYDTGRRTVRLMCTWKRELRVQLILHDGRELPAAEAARHGTARPHEGRRTRAGRSTSSRRPTPSASTPCANWWNWASRGSGWGWNRPRSGYAKLKGADTLQADAELREHGIKLLGSTIVGLEHHTPENIRRRDRARGGA